jgi:predicted PurR-regulated permease PerM
MPRTDSIIQVESGAKNESTFDRAKPIALGLVIAVVSVAGLRVLAELQHVFILVFLALLFASALSLPVAMLERHGVPRGAAVAVVQLVAMAVMVGLVWVVVPPLVSQLGLFAERAPSYVTRFQHIRHEYAAIKRQYPEAGTFDSQISDLAGRLASGMGGRLVNLPLSAAQALFNLMMIYVLSTLLALRRERLLDAAMLLVAPDRRDRSRDVMDKIWARLGAYLRAKLIVMVCVGALMYLSLRLLGVPFAVPLAVIAAFGELVPKVGVWIARIPLLTIAAFQGWTTFGLTFLASYVIEDLKAYVIAPRAEGQALSMDPLLTLLAVLCGTTLLGWEGAMIAVPFAAVLQVVFEEVIAPWRLAQWDGNDVAGEQAAAGDETISLSAWSSTGRRPTVIHIAGDSRAIRRPWGRSAAPAPGEEDGN